MPSKWREVNPFRASLIPAIAGNYAIFFDDKLVYIGQSTNLSNRINSYAFKLGPDSTQACRISFHVYHAKKISVKIRKCRYLGEWLMVEYRLIYRLRPKFNSKKTAVNLSYSKKQRKEVDGIVSWLASHGGNNNG
jgi:excinuclease UvrABC nuclease subunit